MYTNEKKSVKCYKVEIASTRQDSVLSLLYYFVNLLYWSVFFNKYLYCSVKNYSQISNLASELNQ